MTDDINDLYLAGTDLAKRLTRYGRERAIGSRELTENWATRDYMTVINAAKLIDIAMSSLAYVEAGHHA